ncbi:MAG: carbon storage regulator [Candidatus Woesearchaeota archaeon]
MLSLTRKVGDSIIIKVPNTQDIIEVCLSRIDSNERARIGIEAPISYNVVRKEIDDGRIIDFNDKDISMKDIIPSKDNNHYSTPQLTAMHEKCKQKSYDHLTKIISREQYYQICTKLDKNRTDLCFIKKHSGAYAPYCNKENEYLLIRVV